MAAHGIAGGGAGSRWNGASQCLGMGDVIEHHNGSHAKLACVSNPMWP